MGIKINVNKKSMRMPSQKSSFLGRRPLRRYLLVYANLKPLKKLRGVNKGRDDSLGRFPRGMIARFFVFSRGFPNFRKGFSYFAEEKGSFRSSVRWIFCGRLQRFRNVSGARAFCGLPLFFAVLAFALSLVFFCRVNCFLRQDLAFFGARMKISKKDRENLRNVHNLFIYIWYNTHYLSRGHRDKLSERTSRRAGASRRIASARKNT